MLTRKQHELIRFIQTRLEETGVSPSFEEMKEALNLQSKSGVHRLIVALEERGFIRRLPHRARALEVISTRKTKVASWYLDMNGNRQWNNTTGGGVILKFGSATDTPLAGIWRPLDIPNPPFMTGAAPQPKAIPSGSASPSNAVQTVTADQLSAPKAKKLDEYFSSIGTGTVAV